MTTPTQNPTDEEIEEVAQSLTREEIAWLMKIDWRSLQAPKWTFKNKKDLEKLGEALFSGKELKDLDEATLDRIFPHLVKVVQHLGAALKIKLFGSEAANISLSDFHYMVSRPAQASRGELDELPEQETAPAAIQPAPTTPPPLTIVPPKPDISPSPGKAHDEDFTGSTIADPEDGSPP